MARKSTGTNKGGRPATGALAWRRNGKTGLTHWHVRVTMPDLSRPFAPLDPSIPESDLERAKAAAVAASAFLRSSGLVRATVGETVTEYAKRWTAAREERGVASVRSDRYRLEHHVLPTVGALDVRIFTRDDVERVRDRLDRAIALKESADGHMSWKSAANVWTVVTTMCADMVNAKLRGLRVRDDNPARDVKPPERGARKAKQYLYPSEFLQFVSCPRVPLSWRRSVAIAVYTYARDGELRALRWDGGDVDLEHNVLSITRAYSQSLKRVSQTKTGHTRRFALEPHVLPLLRVMRKEAGARGKVVNLVAQNNLPRKFRVLLKRAGITRPELHKPSPTRKAMTFHDLRATGATWMAVRGDDPLKIKQRCGHTTFQTTEGYIREAEAIREGFGDVFPPLPGALLGRSKGGGGFATVSVLPRSKGSSEPKKSGSRYRRRDSNPHARKGGGF
jgi:integrase